jgi:serine/threonine protein kinase
MLRRSFPIFELNKMVQTIYLAKYEAHQLLGEGGMGRVFLGRSLADGKIVVIKVMHDEIAANPKSRQAFLREMELMMRFRHPYAVSLFDASFDKEKTPCIVMEFVPGETLDKSIETQKRLPPPRVGSLLAQLCQVMEAAHANGIIHRDLTPVNVLVMNPATPKEQVKVMDFGLAQMGNGPYISLEKLHGNRHHIGGGTPDYVSPEQVRGEEVDHRGDIYSLGVLLYKSLTGFLPFEKATTTPEILQAHQFLKPPPFSAYGISADLVPHPVEEVVQLCLAKYPNERPQSMLDLLARFEKALGSQLLFGDPIPATVYRPPSVRERIDPAAHVDQLEAWMPEPIAVVKLRGFAHDVGGVIVDSEPGLIRVRLRDPASIPVAGPKSLFAMLGLSKKNANDMLHVVLDLHMEKKTAQGRNLLFITASLRPLENPRRAFDPEWQNWCKNVCRDLKAYLISQ